MRGRDRPPERGIGARLRAARQRLGWSREALAVHCGISYSGIAQIESGRRRNLRPDTLAALAEGLGVSIDYLVDGGARPSTMLEHRALVYRDEDEFVAIAAPFLRAGLERSEALLAAMTPAGTDALKEDLGRDASDVDFVDQMSWYSEPPAALAGIKSFVEDAIKHGRTWARVIAQPVWAKRSEAETRLWARYESLLNLFFALSPVSILCCYDGSSTRPEVLARAEATHPQIVSGSAVADSAFYRPPDEFVFEI